MRWMIWLLLCVVCLNANPIHAEEPAEQAPEQVLEPVLEQLLADDTAKAFVEMSIIGLPAQSQDQIEELMLRLKKLRHYCGKALGEVELIDINRVGNRAVRLTYMEYFESYPIVWRITMYRGSKQWRIVAVNFNSEFGELFEKSNLLSQKPANANR